MSKESEEKVERIYEMVKAIHECLYGNSNPGSGLTDRVTKVETQQRWIVRLMGIAIALLLVLLGVKELPSFLGLLK